MLHKPNKNTISCASGNSIRSYLSSPWKTGDMDTRSSEPLLDTTDWMMGKFTGNPYIWW